MGAANPWYEMVAARAAAVVHEASLSPFEHNGLNGGARELLVRQFLRPFLPSYVGIGSGEVVNHEGIRSRQVDIILYLKENTPPYLLSDDATGLFPWECVIATIEVKSTLRFDDVIDALVNVSSVRYCEAKIQDRSGAFAGDRIDPADLKGQCPPATFLFAFKSDLVTAQGDIGPEWTRVTEASTKINERFCGAAEVLAAPTGYSEQQMAAARADISKYCLNRTDDQDGVANKRFLTGLCVADREWSHFPVAATHKAQHLRFASDFWEVVATGEFPLSNHKGKRPNVHEGDYMVRLLTELLRICQAMRQARSIYAISRYLSLPS